MSIQEIKESLKELKLKGMLETFDSRVYEDNEGKQAFVETFSLLLQDEKDIRQSIRHNRQFRNSTLTEKVTLSDFDWSFNPKIPKAMILKLFDLRFIKTGEDALLIGAPELEKATSPRLWSTKCVLLLNTRCCTKRPTNYLKTSLKPDNLKNINEFTNRLCLLTC